MHKFMVYGGGIILVTGNNRAALEKWIEKDAQQRCEGYYAIFERVADYHVECVAVKHG